ncbi:MAG: hypothetical protein DYG90_00335 [Chloroflexi bacterium CFX6]|nr:hypothetical protein [Chloroflexi bacterium CFX6]
MSKPAVPIGIRQVIAFNNRHIVEVRCPECNHFVTSFTPVLGLASRMRCRSCNEWVIILVPSLGALQEALVAAGVSLDVKGSV